MLDLISCECVMFSHTHTLADARENAVSSEVENDAQVTQRHWMEIRQMVRAIYRENMSLASKPHGLFLIVHPLMWVSSDTQTIRVFFMFGH